MDANTNITFEQMPQALAEVLSQVRLIKEAVMNGDNSRHAGRGSHVLVDIELACEITGGLGHFDDRVKVLLGRQVVAFTDLGACDIETLWARFDTYRAGLHFEVPFTVLSVVFHRVCPEPVPRTL